MRINEPRTTRVRGELYFHVPYRILLDDLPLISENRINCEIYADANALDTAANEELSKINGFFAKEGLRKILHGPFYDLNSGSLDEKIRRASQERYAQALSFCERLSITNVVMHTGFHPIFYAHYKPRWLELSRQTWQAAAGKAQTQNVTICVENSIDTTPDVIVELIEAVNSPNFKACIDVAHYNVFGKLPLLECLKKYPPAVIGEIHLSDNDGTSDAHLALGEGRIDFPAFFAAIDALGISPIITVEPHTPEDIPKSLGYLKNLGLIP